MATLAEVLATIAPLQLTIENNDAKQSLTTTLDGALYEIALIETAGCMSCNVTRNNVRILSGQRTVAGQFLIPYDDLEDSFGNFMFITGDNNTDLPYWTDFGVTCNLFYISATDLQAIRDATLELDPRIVRLTLEVNGENKVYESIGDDGFSIASTGNKFANPLQNQASVKIANLTKADRDFLLNALSPFNTNRTPKNLKLEAGRVSTGTTKVYEGNIALCKPSQPPDIVLEFKCLTGQFQSGQIVSVQQPGSTPLSRIAKGVAASNGLNLTFQATDKNISNYAFAGGAMKQVDALGTTGGVNAYVDDNQLVVKDLNLPLQGIERVLSGDSGMIGIPQITQFGIKVTMLLDNSTKLGGALKIVSSVYPTVNGQYVIYKLGWNIASRDNPFYWIAEALRHNDAGQTVIPASSKIHKGRKGRK